jgi:hypothetical protein
VHGGPAGRARVLAPYAVLAWLRDTAVGLLRQAGHRAVAARLRHHSRHPGDALALLGLRVAENA